MEKRPGRPAWEAISREDSSAVTVRSVAAALQGEFVDVWNISTLQQRALRLVTLGGKRAAIKAVERVIASFGVDPIWARRITTDDLASWAVSLYDDVAGPWDTIIIGAPNGGVAHLATALGVPFLPQHFATNFRGAAPLDDVQAYQAEGAELATRVLRRNSDMAVINHYDPLHDRFQMKYMNRLRYKLLELPEAYQAFIYQNLKPGGTIIFVDCRYPWPIYLIGERHWFQVGGLGALDGRQFIEGEHPQIAALQAAAGSPPVGNWGLKGALAFDMSESKWGTLPPLHERVALFARENAYEFVSLEGAHPEYFAYLAFRVWQRLIQRSDLEPQGILLETATQVAPTATRLASLLPIWMPATCARGVEFLRRTLRDLGPGQLKQLPLVWLAMPDFAETFEVLPWATWMEAFNGAQVLPMGMDERLYPADPTALYGAREALMAWVAEHPAPVNARASVELILEEVRALRRQRF